MTASDDLVSYTRGDDGLYRTDEEHAAERARREREAARLRDAPSD